MHNKIIISFIVILYKQKINIPIIIKSILYSTKNLNDFEIIFIDNNSNDDVKDEIYKYGNINIKYFNNTYPKNQSLSRNIGINNADGNYICFLDGDDYYIPVYLNKIIKLLYNYNKDILFLSRFYEDQNISKIINFNINNIDSAGICYYIIKKNFLIENNIYFDEKKYYYYSEDIVYLAKIMNCNFTYDNIINFDKYNCHYYGKKRITSTKFNDNIKNIVKYYYDMYSDFINNNKNKKSFDNLFINTVKYIYNGGDKN